MNHFKNILLYSFICSLVLFTNCGEDEEEQETTTIITGLSENQDLLIGSWDVVESNQDQVLPGSGMGTIVFSFESDNSVARTETWIDDDLVRILDGNWSFDESDPNGMTLNLFYTESSLTDPEGNNPYTVSSTDNTILTIKSISNKRMSAIENQKIGGISLEFTYNIELIKQ